MSEIREGSMAQAGDLNDEHGLLIAGMKSVVGDKHVLTEDSATRRYRTGFRFGEGKALAVVQPA